MEESSQAVEQEEHEQQDEAERDEAGAEDAEGGDVEAEADVAETAAESSAATSKVSMQDRMAKLKELRVKMVCFIPISPRRSTARLHACVIRRVQRSHEVAC